MAQDVNIQGLACDLASLEVSVDGRPVPESFTSVDPKIDTEYEKIWVNGRAEPVQFTEGKIDPSLEAEMPTSQFFSFVDRLGGQGPNPMNPAFLSKEFELLLSFRPKNQPRTFQIAYHRCRLKSPTPATTGAGKSSMSKFTVDALGVQFLPAKG